MLDDAGRPIGTARKSTVHTASTPLHRAFSCYLFSATGQFLLTRRAQAKATFPGLWTNSVCGHPAPGESDTAAIRRRAWQELQLAVTGLTVVLPDFRCQASSGKIMENGICPVYVGRTSGQPNPEPTEVADWAWVDWTQVPHRLARDPTAFSPWSALQVPQLRASDVVRRYLTDSP